MHAGTQQTGISHILSGVGVFQEYYANSLLQGYSSSTISWIPSLQIFFMLGLVSLLPTMYLLWKPNLTPILLQGPFVGVIFDHYGPRYLLLVGSLLHVVGIMMTSLGSEYYQILLAQGACSAIGAACIFQPCTKPPTSLSSPSRIETLTFFRCQL